MGKENQTILMRAYAKLNLALAVGSAVDDPDSPTHGYHPICSYMHAIELFDTVEIERADKVGFDIAWVDQDGGVRPVEWDIQSDLVFRAHEHIQKFVGRSLPCMIRLRKAIPAGGGMGGGSSNAANVLMGLNHLFVLGLEERQLREISMTLGSDIAYFIDHGHEPARPAIVSGFGEAIERCDRAHAGHELTLLLPPFGCDTREVYRAFDSTCKGCTMDVERVRALYKADRVDDLFLFNDLFTPACEARPALALLHEQLVSSLGVPVHMSGSGSTLFVLGRVEPGLVHEVAPECRVVHTRLC